MHPESIVIIAIYLAFALLEIWRTDFFHKKNQARADGIFELISTLALLGLTQPLVLFLSATLAHMVVPQWQGALGGINPILAFGLFLIFDDMTQYWWHRACHTFPLIYKLHRPHHNAEYMSVRVVYRNNLFFYLLMPSLWLSGLLIYLGLGWVYAIYVVIKLTIIIGAHSDVKWDEALYKIKALSPVMWLVERTISTPSTHHAHHGKHKADGITNYKGNYGNMLFFWDVLFGTAKITRQYPAEYGVENLPQTNLAEQLAWPFFKAKSMEDKDI